MTPLSKDTFLKGALILTVAGIVVKIIGSVNRILLSRLLGGEGMGLYQMAYPAYLLALSVSSAGIPVAISIIVAEKIAMGDYRGAHRVFRISLVVLTVAGFLFSFLLYFGAGWLIDNQFIRDQRAYWAIVALVPAVFFVTILSSYRGYFQGLQMMTPTALSQIAEQLLRVMTMILFAYLLMPYGVEYAAAGASFGAGPGAAAGLLVVMYIYWQERRVFTAKMDSQPPGYQESGLSIVVRIFRLALPVLFANIMLPMVTLIDALIVPARLEVAGYTVQQSTELFGYLTGMAVPLINMPTILTASLAASLVPAVSEAYTLQDRKKVYQRTATAMRISNLITIPAFVGLMLLSTPISVMLYAEPNAGPTIGTMAVGIFLLGIHQITTGVLQGLGHTAIPVVNMAISAGVKIVMSWVLTAMPELGIKGAAWATNFDFGLAALLNMYFVYRYVGFAMDLKDTFRTSVAAAVMGGAVLITYHEVMAQTLHNTLATLAAIAVGGAVYGLILLLAGGVTGRDVERVPRVGSRLAAILRSLRLLRR